MESKLEKDAGALPTIYAVSGSFVPISDDFVAIMTEVRRPPAVAASTGGPSVPPGSRQKRVVLVLDKSGSMSGSKMDTAKSSLVRFIGFLQAHSIREIGLLVFNDHTEFQDFTGFSLDMVKSAVGAVVAGGGTSFLATFASLRDISFARRRGEESDLCVVFFTDGEDTSDASQGKAAVHAGIRSFNADFASCAFSSEFHTIGFGSDHDARLLTSLSSAGSLQGTFQYVVSAAEIAPAVDSLCSVVLKSALSVRLTDGEAINEKVFVTEEEAESETEAKEFTWRGRCFIPKASFDPSKRLHVVVSCARHAPMEIPIDLKAAESVSPLRIIMMTNELVTSQVTQVVSMLSQTEQRPSPDVLEATRIRLDSLDALLTDIFVNRVMRLSPAERKLEAVMAPCHDAKGLIADAHGLLSSAMRGELTNERIATLASKAYSGKLGRGMQKMLDKRVEANVSLLSKNEEEIKSIVENFDFAAIEAKHGEALKNVGICTLSTLSWLDAMRSGDCLCMTLDVSRPESAVADPTQLNVRAVNHSMLTGASFLESVQWALGSKTAEEAHGGFDRHAKAALVVGEARENITGALPLFLCEEHWRVARLRLQPIFGFMTTLNVLGYSESQQRTIPFAVLARAAGSLDSEFHIFQHRLILETCAAIMREHKGLLRETISSFEDYMRSAEFRTIDVIPNIFVFLGQLMAANVVMEGGLEGRTPERMQQFIRAVVEEELRRRQKLDSAAVQDPQKLAFAALCFDEEKFVSNHVRKAQDSIDRMLETGGTSFRAQFLLRLEALNVPTRQVSGSDAEMSAPSGAAVVTPSAPESAAAADVEATATSASSGSSSSSSTGAVNPLRFPEEFDGSLEGIPLSPTAVAMLEGASSVYVKNGVLPAVKLILSLFGDATSADVSSLEAIIPSKTLRMALLIQNVCQAKNSDRRDAIAASSATPVVAELTQRYVDPFAFGMAESILKAHFVRSVSQEKSKRLQAVEESMKAGDAAARSRVFARATDAAEAAGALMGVLQGTPSFNIFVTALEKERCPLGLEKLMMLLCGQYLGVVLVVDKVSHPPCTWLPCRRHAHVLWERYQDLLTKDEWIALMPLRKVQMMKYIP